MSYVVTAPLVLAVDEDGRTHHRYKGDLIEWLSDEQAEHFLSEGLVADPGQLPVESDADGEAGNVAGGPSPGDSTGQPAPGAERPAQVATKDVLVDWLMAHGTYDRAELEGQTKGDLWALIDATD